MHDCSTEHRWAGSWARVRHAVRRNDQVLCSCSANLTVLRVHVRTILEGRQSPLPARPQPCRRALACTRARQAGVTRLRDASQCWPPCSWDAKVAVSHQMHGPERRAGKAGHKWTLRGSCYCGTCRGRTPQQGCIRRLTLQVLQDALSRLPLSCLALCAARTSVLRASKVTCTLRERMDGRSKVVQCAC